MVYPRIFGAQRVYVQHHGILSFEIRFQSKKYIYAIAIFCMTIPIVGSLASNYKLIGELHLYDTPLYAVVTHLSSWGFNFW